MVTGVYGSLGNLLTNLITGVINSKDSITIKKRLLSGQYHVQSIGIPLRVIEISLVINESGKEAIDDCEAQGSTIVFKESGKYYRGIILDRPSWAFIAKDSDNQRWYEGIVLLTVSEEGVDV